MKPPKPDPLPDGPPPVPTFDVLWTGTAINPETGSRVPARIFGGKSDRDGRPVSALVLFPPGRKQVPVTARNPVRRRSLEPRDNAVFARCRWLICNDLEEGKNVHQSDDDQGGRRVRGQSRR